MSSLNENLQEIYNIKLQIKDAIGTDSDVFADYPSLIEEAIGEGGGSGSGDPFYDRLSVEDMIENEESSADYVITVIVENFSLTLDGNDEIEAVEWDYYISVSSVTKKVHVIVSGDPHGTFPSANDLAQFLEDHSELYENIYPTLENATLTASEDPSEDGYDYLLEGDIYLWNLSDNINAIEDVTYNGFYPNDGCCGFDVNVGGGTCAFKFYEAENSYELFTDKTEEEGYPCFTYELGTVTLPQDGMLNWHIRADIDTDYFRYADKYCTGYIEVEPGLGSGSAEGLIFFNDNQGDTIDVYDPNGSEIVMENCIIEISLNEDADTWQIFLSWDYVVEE